MEKPVSKESMILLVVTFVFAILFGFIGVYFDMPYHKWLVSNMPKWFAIVNVSVFGLSFIVIVGKRFNLSCRINNIAMIGMILSMPMFVASLEVEQFINRIIFFSSIIVSAILEGFTRRKKSKNQKGDGCTSSKD